MNLFCISLEGSMESVYEPVPQQAKEEYACSSSEERGQTHGRLFLEASDFEAEKPKRKMSFQKLPSEDKIFEGTSVSDTSWQEPSKAVCDFHLGRPCEMTALINEDGFLLKTNTHIVQGKESPGPSHQAIKSGGDPVGSMRSLKRRQKWLWIKKARVQSREGRKPVLTEPQDGDDTLLSCVKLIKSQEKKEINMSTKKREEPNSKSESLPVPGCISSTSNGHIMQDTMSPYEAGVPVWKKWEPFSENALWTSDDFPVAPVGHWGGSCSCSHHLRLKSSYTDTDLLNTWNSVKLKRKTKGKKSKGHCCHCGMGQQDGF